MTNEELRELVAKAIDPTFGVIGTDAATSARALAMADKVLALPRIKAGLEALERDEAMARKALP